MPIINQNLSPGLRKEQNAVGVTGLGTGVTLPLQIVPFNCSLKGFNCAFFGISGSPVHSLSVFRFNATGGLTSVGLGVTYSPVTFGTSGVLLGPFGVTGGAGVSNISGITVLQGDVLTLTTAGANSAVNTGLLQYVLEALDDIPAFQNAVN